MTLTEVVDGLQYLHHYYVNVTSTKQKTIITWYAQVWLLSNSCVSNSSSQSLHVNTGWHSVAICCRYSVPLLKANLHLLFGQWMHMPCSTSLNCAKTFDATKWVIETPNQHSSFNFWVFLICPIQPVFICSKLTMETLELDVNFEHI